MAVAWRRLAATPIFSERHIQVSSAYVRPNVILVEQLATTASPRSPSRAVLFTATPGSWPWRCGVGDGLRDVERASTPGASCDAPSSPVVGLHPGAPRLSFP